MLSNPLNKTHNTAFISAAGAGKTWSLCNDALRLVKESREKRVLITTYTNRGVEAIREVICLQNSGILHPRVIIKTWFSFLLSDLIKPYQRYLDGRSINSLQGIDFSETYGSINMQKTGTRARYLTKSNNIRSNHVAELAVVLNKRSSGLVISRVEEIYNAIFFDEIQDLAGYDIDIIKLLIESRISITCSGDSKQATFSTHNARKNKYQTGKNIWVFINELEKAGMITVKKNLTSRRFNSQICAFANSIFPSGEAISTVMEKKTEHDGVYIIGVSDASSYYDYYNPQVLRFDSKTIVPYQAMNFGACKGKTYQRIMVFPNGPLKDFLLNGKQLDSPQKYYVGVTRPMYSIAIVLQKLPKEIDGFKRVIIKCGSDEIYGFHFSGY